jgi:hypothetical protein
MRLLLLSGNSLRNRDWIMTAQQQFSDLFNDSYVQSYRHWTSGDDWIDLDYELKVLQQAENNPGAASGIFAKSIGTVLAVQATAQHIVQPDWLLLCGLPYGYIIKSYPEFARVLAATELPVTVVHNRHDPVGEAQAVKSYLAESFSGRDNYSFIETAGDTHDYEDFELLRAQLTTLRDADGNRRD